METRKEAFEKNQSTISYTDLCHRGVIMLDDEAIKYEAKRSCAGL